MRGKTIIEDGREVFDADPRGFRTYIPRDRSGSRSYHIRDSTIDEIASGYGTIGTLAELE
jgi:hypothetical protein